MRVLQLIDTLRPGGAENMAINMANLLVDQVDASFLCCTRSSGVLEERLNPKVKFLCLRKKNSIDIFAFNRLKKYVIKNHITTVHAHSTSFFFGCLLKIFKPEIKLVWHDHYGESENLTKRNKVILRKFSRYFDGVLVVNENLKKWAIKNLKVQNVQELNNFVVSDLPEPPNFKFQFSGSENDFRIVCVANLRPQKNHLALIEAFEMIKEKDLSLHLFGMDPGTLYSGKVLNRIGESSKSDWIYFYGARKEINSILPKANLGVLPSRSEGLPLVLLEYCHAGLPIVCTDVGESRRICGDFGKVVEPNNPKALANAIQEYYLDENSRRKDSLDLRTKVAHDFNKKVILEELLQFYNTLLD